MPESICENLLAVNGSLLRISSDPYFVGMLEAMSRGRSVSVIAKLDVHCVRRLRDACNELLRVELDRLI